MSKLCSREKMSRVGRRGSLAAAAIVAAAVTSTGSVRVFVTSARSLLAPNHVRGSFNGATLEQATAPFRKPPRAEADRRLRTTVTAAKAPRRPSTVIRVVASASTVLAALPRRTVRGAVGRRSTAQRAFGATAVSLATSLQAFQHSTLGFMLRLTTLNFCKIYVAMLVLRITIMWFPNVNPYRQPFYSMIQLTDPYLNLFRGWIPPIFGIDLSVLLAFVVIQAVIDTLTVSPF
eukprot:TRINITY_DN53717_c0_g1_i1.p1 TRINITY_DN53717_c0_g1~~TRINITY_DN53717_c0_g1_i1.p1  ORF type:complete len:233 (+),score=18.99 TRINITY_DN53717_c0_g1_i1:63-761(+)